jgi:hypothetical protein
VHLLCTVGQTRKGKNCLITSQHKLELLQSDAMHTQTEQTAQVCVHTYATCIDQQTRERYTHASIQNQTHTCMRMHINTHSTCNRHATMSYQLFHKVFHKICRCLTTAAVCCNCSVCYQSARLCRTTVANPLPHSNFNSRCFSTTQLACTGAPTPTS